jgi:hypothetical protein
MLTVGGDSLEQISAPWCVMDRHGKCVGETWSDRRFGIFLGVCLKIGH